MITPGSAVQVITIGVQGPPGPPGADGAPGPPGPAGSGGAPQEDDVKLLFQPEVRIKAGDQHVVQIRTGQQLVAIHNLFLVLRLPPASFALPDARVELLRWSKNRMTSSAAPGAMSRTKCRYGGFVHPKHFDQNDPNGVLRTTEWPLAGKSPGDRLVIGPATFGCYFVQDVHGVVSYKARGRRISVLGSSMPHPYTFGRFAFRYAWTEAGQTLYSPLSLPFRVGYWGDYNLGHAFQFRLG